MKTKKRSPFLILFLLLGILLAACGGGDIDTDAFKEVTNEMLGVTIGYPEEWIVNSEPPELQIATTDQLFEDPESVDEGAVVSFSGLDTETLSFLSEEEIEPGDAVAYLNLFADLVLEGEEDFTVTEEATAVTYNDNNAAFMTMDTVSDDGTDLFVMFVAIPNDDVIAYLFAVTPADQEEEYRPYFEAMFNTIELSAPEMATLSEELDTEEVAAAEEPEPTPEPEPTAEPEPTDEPEPTPEPTEEPAPETTFSEEAFSEIIGVTLSYPEGWASEIGESGDIQIGSDPAFVSSNDLDLTSGAVVAATSLDNEILAFFSEEEFDMSDPVAVANVFSTLFTESAAGEDEEYTIRQEATAVTIAGYDAAVAIYDVTTPEEDGVLKLIALVDSAHNRAVILVGGISADDEAEFMPTVDAIIETIVLSEPESLDLGLGDGGSDEEEDTAMPSGEAISQYATSAFATTEYSDDSWSAAQATGAPDTPACGDEITAWATESSDGIDSIELFYDTPVYAVEVVIYQTYNPNQVVQVELISTEGEYVTVYEGAPTAVDDPCPFVMTIPADGDILADGVRVTLDQSQLGLGWNEIDAVELYGMSEGSTSGTTSSSSGGGAAGMVGSGGEATVRDDVPRVPPASGLTMFSNGNEVFDIAVQDGTIYGASGGGLVAWDYASGEPIGKWTTLDGLGHNVTSAITICPLPEERVVIGTKVGLSLFDPATGMFENWTTENSGMSSDDGVVALHCVPEINALVIGYDLDGVEVYEAASDTWTYYAPFDQLESGFAEALAVKGNLDEIWVAHIGAVSKINHQTGDITYYDDENGLDIEETDQFEHFVEDIVVDNNGTVWFAQGGGLTRVDGDGQFTFFSSEEIAGWPFWSGTDDLTIAADGAIWTNDTLGGICQYDPASNSCLTSFEDETGMADSFNNGITVDAAGQIFYGSEGEGISYYDGATWHNFQIEEKPLSNRFNVIAQGADGSIWVGGYDGAQKFFAYDAEGTWEDLSDHLSWYSVSSFYPEADGMWVGHSNGASFYNYDSGSWTDFESADEAGDGIFDGEVTAIARDGHGRMWFGTIGGVTVWDGDTFTYFDLLTDTERADGRSALWVNTILVEGNNAWIGGDNVLYRFDTSDESLQTFTRWDEDNGLPGFFPRVNDIAQDLDGNVLLAIDGNLMMHDGADNFTEIYDAGNNIHSILVDDEGVIAVGTDGAGLHINLDGQWVTLTTADGLPSNRLAGDNILIDYQESLWVAASEGGIVQISP